MCLSFATVGSIVACRSSTGYFYSTHTRSQGQTRLDLTLTFDLAIQYFREHHPMRYNRMTEVLKTVASVKLSSTFLLKSYFLKNPLECLNPIKSNFSLDRSVKPFTRLCSFHYMYSTSLLLAMWFLH